MSKDEAKRSASRQRGRRHVVVYYPFGDDGSRRPWRILARAVGPGAWVASLDDGGPLRFASQEAAEAYAKELDGLGADDDDPEAAGWGEGRQGERNAEAEASSGRSELEQAEAYVRYPGRHREPQRQAQDRMIRDQQRSQCEAVEAYRRKKSGMLREVREAEERARERLREQLTYAKAEREEELMREQAVTALGLECREIARRWYGSESGKSDG